MNGTESNKNMFWGLSLTAGNEYSQTVEKSFHISMAALDLSKSKAGGYSSVLLKQGKSEFVLCSLHPEKLVNQTLDLNFNEGEEVTFRHNGTGVIHLTGYVLNDMDDLAGSLDEFDSDGESNENEMSDDEEEIGGKRKKAQPVTAPASKKLKADGTVAKKGALFDDEDDDDDDDEDDEDFDEDDDFIDDEAEEADSDDDKEEDEEENEEVDEDEEGDEEDEVVSKKKPLKQIEAAPTKAEATTDAAADKKKKKKNKKNKAEESDKPQPGTPRPATDKPQGGQPKKRVLEGNVIVEELKEGHGPDAKNGKMAHVYYTGRLLSNNKVFDQNNSGAPFKFRLDKGEVIKGWDIGLKGMRVGGKRRITIPPKMAYGSQSQSGIPANSTLVFDVELKALS